MIYVLEVEVDTFNNAELHEAMKEIVIEMGQQLKLQLQLINASRIEPEVSCHYMDSGTTLKKFIDIPEPTSPEQE